VVKSIRSSLLSVVTSALLLMQVMVPVSANTDSEERNTWEEVEEYCLSFLGDFAEPTCADYVSMIMQDCSYYPGTFTQHPRAKEMRKMLVDNEYNLVASNITYRKSAGMGKEASIRLGNWIGDHAQPGDILIWVRNTTHDVDATGCCHVSIYCGVKEDMKEYNGQTTWPSHISDKGAGGIVVCQPLWEYINKGPNSGRGYGIYIYRRPGDEIKNPKQGKWYQDDIGFTFTGLDGKAKRSEFVEIKGSTYYFDEMGYMVTGFREIDDKTYYFRKDGSMAVGWKQVGDDWYLFDNEGAARNGWVRQKKTYYYIGDDLKMTTGVTEIDGRIYGFNSDGSMAKNRWVKGGKEWYYFDGKGEPSKYVTKHDGVLYLTDKDGNPLSGWYKYGKGQHYFEQNGKLVSGWKKIDGNWYYFRADGLMMTGLQYIDNNYYYFDKEGVMKTGWIKAGGKTRYFTEDGAAAISKWQTIDGKTYRFDGDGKKVKGLIRINNRAYYLDKKGVMYSGWKEVDGKTYFFTSKGYAQTGWKRIRNNWYFFDEEGVMLTSSKVTLGTREYVFNSEGVCVNI